ncbi:MAG: hypothetical protein K2O43_01180 [Muribaculaceae bacterium]|nr:hypothetical protein [Muribaculaceae bacterium]
MNEIKEIETLLSENRLDEALDIIDKMIKQGSDNLDLLYFYRGKVNWRKGFNTQAITDYEHSVAINPKSKASHALEMARNVIDYFDSGLLNP